MISPMRIRSAWLAALLVVCTGCGTTKWTDTARTATEQLLISDAVDRSVSQLDLRALAGKTIYLDTKPLATVTDKDYVISTIRQHVLASGGILKEKLEDAEYVVEVRAGAVGTNHHDVLLGVPSTTLPATTLTGGVASTIPELALAKKAEQMAVAKIYVFAYNRQTGRPVWQSGAVPGESKAKNVWLLGAGPFQSGNIYKGTEFLGDRVKIPLVDPSGKHDGVSVSIADEAYFVEPSSPQKEVASQPSNPLSQSEPPKPAPAKPAAEPQPAGAVVPTAHTAAPGNANSPAPVPAAPLEAVPYHSTVSPFGDTGPIQIPVISPQPPASGTPQQPSVQGQGVVKPLPPVTPSDEELPQKALLDQLRR